MIATLAALGKPWYVGAHFPATKDLEGILAANRRNLERTAEAVLGAVTSTVTTEEVVARAAQSLGVLSMDPSAYLLNAAAIKAHGKWIDHVHLADSQRRQPGSGEKDFAPGFKALKAAKYKQYMTLECGVTGDDRMKALKATVRALETALKQA